IVGGSHDLLLEWALRESRCGLASLPEGSTEGLRRLSSREIMMAAIHLHAVDQDPERANTDAVADSPGLRDAVVIAFARREQGILVNSGNPCGITDIASIARTRVRVAQRPPGAGAQLLLLALLARAGIPIEDVAFERAPCPTDVEIAHAVRSGLVDCGIT